MIGKTQPKTEEDDGNKKYLGKGARNITTAASAEFTLMLITNNADKGV